MPDCRHTSFTQAAIESYFGAAMHAEGFPRPLYRRDDDFVWSATEIYRYIGESRDGR
jgi:hypothetical protein